MAAITTITQMQTEILANKVPLLGSIPLLGRAFRGTSNQVMKKNLMVFIHPRILRTAADSAMATHLQYQRLQSLQEHSNQDADRFLIPGAALPLLPPLPTTVDDTVPAAAASATDTATDTATATTP